MDAETSILEKKDFYYLKILIIFFDFFISSFFVCF